MLSQRCWTQLILVLALALLAGPTLAQADKEKADEEKEINPYLRAAAEKSGEDKDAKGVVYTNADLKRLFSAEEPAAAEKGDEKKAAPAEAAKKPADTEDPLEWMKRREVERAERQEAIVAAEAKVTELRQLVAKYESGLLVVRNPLLTRRVAPKRPPEGSELAEGWDGQDNVKHVERVEKGMEEARKELKEAEAALARLRSG